MTFAFSQEELSYMAKSFGYQHLEGADFIKFDKKSCEASLLEKGYILPYKKSFELSNEIRLLLSAWVGIRYTLIRDSFLSDERVFAILASPEYILTYSLNKGSISMNMGNFSPEDMDRILADYLNIIECGGENPGFNISFSGEEYLAYFSGELSDEAVSGKTGLLSADIAQIKATLDAEDGVSFIVQNVKDDIGCMGALKRYEDGYVMVKHIVPNTAIDRQKIVVVKGNAQAIIDSIYIL